MQQIKKIVILGPESTGKSTLCTLLAKHYDTLWCPEYAREYLHTNGADYTYDDLLTIAKGQLALEEQFIEKVKRQTLNDAAPIKQPRILFIDTDMNVMRVWCEFVFGKCHHFILDKLNEQKVDLYLLCNVDLPWVRDELREHPDLKTRERLYDIYKDIMLNQTVPWVDIHGHYRQRLEIATAAINNHFFASGV